MSSRTIQHPDVELHEIDRSGYGKTDNSLPNSPTTFVMGFAAKGQDMTIEWINSKSTLDETFGAPETEFESYMYNAAMEVLNRGGSCIASKLPYDNEQFQKYNYIDFDASQFVTVDSTSAQLSVNTVYKTIGDIHDSLAEVLLALPGMESTDIGSVCKMADTIVYINETYLPGTALDIQPVTIDIVNDLSVQLVNFIENYLQRGDGTFSLMYFNDFDLTSYIDIKVKQNQMSREGLAGGKDLMENLDRYLTSRSRVQPGTIRIYDMTRAQYDAVDNYNCVSSEQLSSFTNECLGIVPVIVTPANAMYFQNLLNIRMLSYSMMSSIDYSAYNSVSSFQTLFHRGVVQSFDDIEDHTSIPIASMTAFENVPFTTVDSLSKRAALQFPPINFYTPDHFDKTNLKKIGVVVFKAFKDTGNNGRIGFQLLESFVGSLEKNARDPVTKANIFIDDVVNQNSQFIALFSNVDQQLVKNASTYAMSKQPAVSMGFYREDCAKDISFINSIIKPMTTVLQKAENPNVVPVDIVVDAGMSNIAQLCKNYNGLLKTDDMPRIGDYSWKFDYAHCDVSGWRAVVQKLDNFCKNVRKDCMFLADGIRPMCLEGNAKIVRPTAPQNTVTNSVIPSFKYIAHAVDSSYSAGYCNWFMQQDYSNLVDYIWMPPSVKAAGVYTYCDIYFHPWSAPAGHTRGIVGDAVDIAFQPSDQDSDIIYSNSWNYAMSYPLDGIVIEGHKTFQSQQTALDRVNVRRLMLSLEKQVVAVARTFVYEQNTPYMRQQFVDNITPILENAVAGSGISEYAIKCDEELNPPQVVENNEMRCKIAVRPVKVVDYLRIDFICTNQSVSINEEILR